MRKFHINDVVYCYYDEEISCVKGKIISKRQEINDNVTNKKLYCYKVHWDRGGSSEFSAEHIFTTQKECLDFAKQKKKKIEENRDKLFEVGYYDGCSIYDKYLCIAKNSKEAEEKTNQYLNKFKMHNNYIFSPIKEITEIDGHKIVVE
jgi:hypothetical protein